MISTEILLMRTNILADKANVTEKYYIEPTGVDGDASDQNAIIQLQITSRGSTSLNPVRKS